MIKVLPRKMMTIVVLIGVLFSVGFIFGANLKKKNNIGSTIQANANVFSEQEKMDLPLPTRLRIPHINVDANIEPVGLTPEGLVDVPEGPDGVAWFNVGPLPGEIGSAVIDGHSGYKDDKPAVFDNLYKLKKGDKIYVEDEGGGTTIFVVRESQRYKPNTRPAEVFSSGDGGAHLNLITCTGLWDNTEKTHSDRLVVFADRETAIP
jgi:sortase A